MMEDEDMRKAARQYLLDLMNGPDEPAEPTVLHTADVQCGHCRRRQIVVLGVATVIDCPSCGADVPLSTTGTTDKRAALTNQELLKDIREIGAVFGLTNRPGGRAADKVRAIVARWAEGTPDEGAMRPRVKPEVRRCKGHTGAGRPCGMTPMKNSEWCFRHRPRNAMGGSQ